MKQAVCTLIRNPEGKILGVSRRNDPDNMNLPGGKVDPGETLEEACIRETREETNLHISNLRLVFQRPCEGPDTYDAYCFAADYEGEPKALEEGFVVRWITWDELLKPTNQFAHYNQRLFEAVRIQETDCLPGCAQCAHGDNMGIE